MAVAINGFLLRKSEPKPGFERICWWHNWRLFPGQMTTSQSSRRLCVSSDVLRLSFLLVTGGWDLRPGKEGDLKGGGVRRD